MIKMTDRAERLGVTYCNGLADGFYGSSGYIVSLLAVYLMFSIKFIQASMRGKMTLKSKKKPRNSSLKLFKNPTRLVVLCLSGACVMATTALVNDPIQAGPKENENENVEMMLHESDADNLVPSSYSSDGNEKDATITKPVQTTFVQESTEQLVTLTRRLRGNAEPAESLSEVHDIMTTQLKGMQSMQSMYEDGDDRGLASALKSIISEGSALAKASQEVKGVPGLALPEMDLSLNSPDGIPDTQVTQFYQPEFMEEIIVSVQAVIEMLEDVKDVIHSPSQSHRSLKDNLFSNNTNGNAEHISFDNEPLKPGSQYAESNNGPPIGNLNGPANGNLNGHPNGHPNGKLGSNSNGRGRKSKFNPQDFFNNKLGLGKITQQARAEGHSQLPDLSKHINIEEDADALERRLHINNKHQRRTQELDVCRPKCEPEDLVCNCERLLGCANLMTDYDLALLFVEGFIERDQDDEQYGNFTVENITELSLFDADFNILNKIERVRRLANDATSQTNQDMCAALLSELHSACNPVEESCSGPNRQSFQLSTNDVCDAVNTPVKLLLASISDEMDGYESDTDTSSCGNERLAFAACNEFAQSFDLLYEHRDLVKYPLSNPMRMGPLTSVKDSDFINFPTSYNFIKTVHGVNDLDFGADSPSFGSSSFSTFDEVRVVHDSNKCMTVTSNNDVRALDCRDTNQRTNGHAVKVSLSGSSKILTLAEVQVFAIVDGVETNIALSSDGAVASQSSTHTGIASDYGPSIAIDGITRPESVYGGITHTVRGDNPWWRVDLPESEVNVIKKVILWNRSTYTERLSGAKVSILDDAGNTIAERSIGDSSGVLRFELDFSKQAPNADQIFHYDAKTRHIKNGNLCLDHSGSVKMGECNNGRNDQKWYYDQFTQELKTFYDHNCLGMNLSTGDLQMYPCSVSEVAAVGYPGYNHPTNGVGKYFQFDVTEWRAYFGSFTETLIETLIVKQCRAGAQVKTGTVKVWEDHGTGRWDQGTANYDWKTYDYIVKPEDSCADATAMPTKFAIPSFWLPSVQLDKVHVLSGDLSDPSECMTTFPDNERNVYMGNCTAENDYQDYVYDASTEQVTQNGLCLFTASGSQGDNAYMTLCTGEENQKWYFVGNTMKSRASVGSVGMCLERSTASGNLHISTCSRDNDQKENNQKFLIPPDWRSSQTQIGAYNSRPIIKKIWDHTHCITDVLKDVIGSCDDSMSLLLGSTTSLGTLRSIAELIQEKGPGRMPGVCCLDLPTSSQYFGYNYDPRIKDSNDVTMQCENAGPWHLGLSPDTCERANGRWFRSPCVTLKECIDNRPASGTDHVSPTFEDFAKNFVIDDPNDEARCQQVRGELGFEPDHPFDTEVCQEFESYMCDRFFDDLDDIVEGLDEPTTYGSIEYKDIEYPDDPPLSFDKLPVREPFLDPELGKHTDLVNLQQQLLNREGELFAMNNLWEAAKEYDDKCDVMPDDLHFPFFTFSGPITLTFPNFAKTGCKISAIYLQIVVWIPRVAVGVAHQIVHKQYVTNTLGPDAQMDGSIRLGSLFDNFKSFDKWNHEALGTINKNINTQHTEMRGHLQERHEQMTNDINTFTADVGNHVAATILDALGADVNLPDTGRRLQASQLPQLDVQWPNGNLLKEVLQTKSALGLEHDGNEADQMKRNIMKIGMGGQAQVDAVESNVKSVDANVKAIESKVDLVKAQVDMLENKMDEMKDMMSKLMEMMK